MAIIIKLDRASRVYHPGDILSGTVIIQTPNSLSHNGIELIAEGTSTLKLNQKSGLLDALYSTVKPTQMMQYIINISPPGKVPKGLTDFPFELKLQPFAGKELFETYQGVYVVHLYTLTCKMERKMLRSPMQQSMEFIITRPDQTRANQPQEASQKHSQATHRVEFEISPNSLKNVRKQSRLSLPSFMISGFLESDVMKVSEPCSGEVVVKQTDSKIRSIELQLVRVEACALQGGGEAREATEIQNIQLADRNIPTNFPIPIHMIFPRRFTCATVVSSAFKVEFELNLIVIFEDSHMITENFPITLYR